MSSTILYLAIVAIWAGVLVPRWLRREPHREIAGRSQRVGAVPDAGSLGSDAGSVFQAAAALVADRGLDEFVARRGAGQDRGRRPDRHSAGRARAMAARRRLLWILVVFACAAVTIAAAGLAAWWVAAPPACMLAGYVLLLREAARADAERAKPALPHAESAHAGLADGALDDTGHDTGLDDTWLDDSALGDAGLDDAGLDDAGLGQVRGAVARAGGGVRRRAGAMAETVAGPAVSPVPDTEDAGTANVVDITARVDEELYDQYADAKLRAVGD